MPIDPVCGMVVPEEHASECVDYKGKHYCFCSEECKDEFEMDPETDVLETADVTYEEEESF